MREWEKWGDEMLFPTLGDETVGAVSWKVLAVCSWDQPRAARSEMYTWVEELWSAAIDCRFATRRFFLY